MFNINTKDTKNTRWLSAINLKNKKIFLLFLLVLLIFFLGFLFFRIYVKQSKKINENPSNISSQDLAITQRERKRGPENVNIKPSIKTNFRQYKSTTADIDLPTLTRAYSFKTNYTGDEIRNFARKIGLTNLKKLDERYYLLFEDKNSDKLGIVLFDSFTGGFNFVSYGSRYLSSLTQGPIKSAEEYLKKIGMFDETINCQITYQRSNQPDITYVECHRDWEKMQLPILNNLGIINLPEGENIDSLKVGYVGENGEIDPEIVNVSTGENGKRRPNGFNTITVGINTVEDLLVSIDSNMRWIKETMFYPSESFYQPDLLEKRLAKKDIVDSFVIPAGRGDTDLDTIFANDGEIVSNEATITDYTLVFIEEPQEIVQNKLYPVYLVRGTAELDNGYTVRFTHIMNAIENYGLVQKKKQGFSANGSSIKFGSFYPTIATPVIREENQKIFPSPTKPSKAITLPTQAINRVVPSPPITLTPEVTKPVTPIEVTKPVTPTEFIRKIGQFICRPSRFDMKNIRLTPNGYAYGFYGGRYYYIPDINDKYLDSKNEFIAKIREVWESARENIQGKCVKKTGANCFRMYDDLYRDYIWKGGVCPIRLTGGSPSIYFYTDKEMQLKIEIPAKLTYTYPAARNLKEKNTESLLSSEEYPDGALWKIKVDKNGKLDGRYRRLYYEYNPSAVKLSGTSPAIVVEKNKWKDAVEIISKRLGLNLTEKEDLIKEVSRLFIKEKFEYPYIKFSLAPKILVDKQLPLYIYPQPDRLYRIFLIVEPEKQYIQQPAWELEKIKREGFTVVEIGVYDTLFIDN